MKKIEALAICTQNNIPLGADFHTLQSEVITRILQAADLRGYRKPKDANGSRARYFYAMLTRASNAKVNEYVVQGKYGCGWEDLTADANRKDARAMLKDYEQNENNPHRLIVRRVPA